MPEPHPHNTKSLQSAFPEVYRDFFSRCHKVASASNSFLWAGEFSGFYPNGLLISQKLPFRSYVGLEYTLEKKISVDGQYLTYEADRQTFNDRTLDDQLIVQFTEYLEKIWDSIAILNGVRVHILTEAPIGHGLGSNGALAAALALSTSQSNKLSEHFSLARQILAKTQHGYSSGVSAYSALADCQGPIVYIDKEKSYFAKPLAELVKLNKDISWPIDFGLIYTGTQANSGSVVMATEHTANELESTSHNLSVLLKHHPHPNFQKTFLDMLNMTAGLMATGFSQLFTHGSDDNALRLFFNSINQYQNLLHILELTTKTGDIIYSRIHQLANKETNGVGSGVKISGIGKGGAMLFALPFGTHRSTIEQMVADIRNAHHTNVWLDYASWKDGIASEPGRIEQDTSNKILSTFISRGTVSMVIINKGQVNHQVIADEQLDHLSRSVDLLLDQTSGKILIAGTTLTSKQMPSQKSTVEILAKLLTAPDYKLPNSQIPGTYGSNRYDLQGKIVMPLIKEIKRITKRDLQINVKGGMFDDFTLNLNPDNIVFAVIEDKA